MRYVPSFPASLTHTHTMSHPKLRMAEGFALCSQDKDKPEGVNPQACLLSIF